MTCAGSPPICCIPLRVGRVIARPFVGETVETFKRTPQPQGFRAGTARADAVRPGGGAGGRTLAIGKIGDIFAHRGIPRC